jgi:hypothetical protein
MFIDLKLIESVGVLLSCKGGREMIFIGLWTAFFNKNVFDGPRGVNQKKHERLVVVKEEEQINNWKKHKNKNRYKLCYELMNNAPDRKLLLKVRNEHSDNT